MTDQDYQKNQMYLDFLHAERRYVAMLLGYFGNGRIFVPETDVRASMLSDYGERRDAVLSAIRRTGEARG